MQGNDYIIKSILSSFADDTKINHGIKSYEDAEDMQNYLEILYTWQDINNMQFNDTKFQLLQFGKDKHKFDYWYMTPNCSNPIILSDNVKDLGVIIDSKLIYKDHINDVCNKVKKKTGCLLRTFHNRKADLMKFLWKCYIIPNIDYCSQLWGLNCRGLLLRLENLQKDFTSRAKGMSNISYWNRLKTLKLLSINRRIKQYRVLYTRKILTGATLDCEFK